MKEDINPIYRPFWEWDSRMYKGCEDAPNANREGFRDVTIGLNTDREYNIYEQERIPPKDKQ